MLENIPEDFEFVCVVDYTHMKISEIDEIYVEDSGRPVFMTRRSRNSVIFREKVGTRGETFQKGTEEFDQLLFECYTRTVLK